MTPAADSSPSTPTRPVTGLTAKQLSTFWRDGFLIIPSYLSEQEYTAALAKTHDLLHNLDLSNHPMTKFTQEHVGDDYFLSSGDQVRFFFEEDAFTASTGGESRLCKPKEKAINKIGHNLHGLVDEFAQISHRGALGARNAAVARDLGFRDARLLQSMVICKQPEIGGAVPPHQDSTFLYTDRPSAVGFWFALQDATVKAGDLVLIHGNVLHKSERNVSDRGRMAYTFHLIEGEEHYDERNWLQVPGGPAAFTKLDGRG
ncbi:hypothetical protein DV735_g4107, partial [Chaetothyriales sp. CBS 134920]